MCIGFHSCPPMQRPSLCLTKSLPTSSERIPPYPTMPVLFALLPTMFTLCLMFQPSLNTGSPAAVFSWCDSFSSSWAGQTPHASEPLQTQNCSSSLSSSCEADGSFYKITICSVVMNINVSLIVHIPLFFIAPRAYFFYPYARYYMRSHQSSFTLPHKTLVSLWHIS